jgi:hypothetical protein
MIRSPDYPTRVIRGSENDEKQIKHADDFKNDLNP